MFSICVLLYGDHPDLAARCLKSLVPYLTAQHVTDVRIGLNSVSAATLQHLGEFHNAIDRTVPCYVLREKTGRNVYKYPLMRHLFYSPMLPPLADRVMWFDDDSYVRPEAGAAWMLTVASACGMFDPDVMGSRYKPGYSWAPSERAAIRASRWYGGLPLDPRPWFATGGWWVARSAFLREWEYPFRELAGNGGGGDVLLGELVRQRRGKLTQFNTGIAINADAAGRESESVRRGPVSPRAFLGHPRYDYTHQTFEVERFDFGFHQAKSAF